jgi:dienelactone hydrolase
MIVGVRDLRRFEALAGSVGRPFAGVGFAILICTILAGCLSGGMGASGDAEPGKVAGIAGDGGRGEDWLIPSTQGGFLMRAKIFRPAGDGPFPLAVINHGSQQGSIRQKSQPPAFPELTNWFLDRGYAVVLPERPGHGGGGRYLEDQGGCAKADYVKAGNGAADSIEAAIAYLKQQPFAESRGIVVAGHSAGGWGSLAYAARRPSGVRAVINFSGGRGGHNLHQPLNNCSPERLVTAAGVFGGTTRVPTLWLYAENDTFFPPALSQAMATAFRNSGGRAEYHLFPPLAGDGHFVIRSTGWNGILQQFLDAAPEPES